MKLIVKQYLSPLKERGELDVVLPDLLSQLGLNVFSRPAIGTRQDGVDVAAVGSLNNEPETVYLFSIKSGDLDRSSWNGDSLQSLRPSLDQIRDSYIPNRLPKEHKEKKIKICICLGGDIKEGVRTDVAGYIEKAQNDTNIKIEEWNGDKLAHMILSSFLHENLLPKNLQSHLRKSIALIYEPPASYRHFKELIIALTKIHSSTKKIDQIRLRVLRQMNLCLWILFAWARDEKNIESAYLCSELTLLYAWNISKDYSSKKTKSAKGIETAFYTILEVHHKICEHYIEKITPHVKKKYAISHTISASNRLNVNLKLFDVLGRLAIRGVWEYQKIAEHKKLPNSDKFKQELEQWPDTVKKFSTAICNLIHSNPVLLLPAKEDQAIDIAITLFFLSQDPENHNFIKNWLNEMLDRAIFSYKNHGIYPCVLDSYSDLLEHPAYRSDEYREEKTCGSWLYPLIALWAAVVNDIDLYEKLRCFKQENLQHCTFQFWYPNEISEGHFYIHSALMVML